MRGGGMYNSCGSFYVLCDSGSGGAAAMGAAMLNMLIMLAAAATESVVAFKDGFTAPLYHMFWPGLATFYAVVLLAATCAVVFRDARRTYLD